MSRLAAPGVRGLAPYEPGMPVEHLERRYGIRGAVKLASNENPRGAPAAAIAAAREALAGAHRYPDGGGFALRESLAAALHVSPESLTLGNGSNDILVLLAETFLTAADAAVYDQYSFVVYRLAVQACGAEGRSVPSLPSDHAMPLGHDLAAMRDAVDGRTRLVFIANPNNPTGSWVARSELRRFLDELPDTVVAVLDEAYLEYARQPGDVDSLTWMEELPNLVVVRTFSKAWGLAGLRLGYAVSSPEIAELLNRVRQPFNVNSAAQAAACACLGDDAWLADTVAANRAGMRQLADGLEALGIRVLPSRGNFVLADMGSAARAATAYEHLLRAGVIVRPVANYGLADYLRITVGLPNEIDRLLNALADLPGGSA